MPVGHSVWNDLSVTDGPASEPSMHQVLVATDTTRAHWTLTIVRKGRDWLLALRGDGMQDTWAASGPDLFEALRNLRRLIDPLGFRLALNGARRDAWASGMQRDMGEGRYVYLLEPGQTGRPEQGDTLGTAPIELIGQLPSKKRITLTGSTRAVKAHPHRSYAA